GRAGGESALRRMAVTIAFARDGTLAADVERTERVDLTAAGRAYRHAVLLLHVRIRCRRLHPSELDWRSRVLTIVGQQGGHGDRLRWELQRSTGAGRTAGRRDWGAISGDQAIAHAVVCARAIDICAHEVAASDLRLVDRAMHIG